MSPRVRAIYPFCSVLKHTQNVGDKGYQSAFAHLPSPYLRRIKNKSSVFAGMTPLGCLRYNRRRYINQCIRERLKPLKLCPRAHQGLADNSQAICAPFPAGPNLRCNFCSCQSFFLSPRLFCKNTSCSEGSLPFINSETERSRAGRGTKRSERQGIKSSPNKPSFLCKLELEACVK